jgi:hypothetical protein
MTFWLKNEIVYKLKKDTFTNLSRDGAIVVSFDKFLRLRLLYVSQLLQVFDQLIQFQTNS